MSRLDLYMDYGHLSRMRGEIAEVSETMSKVVEMMSEVDGTAMGLPRVAKKVDEFGTEWEYGIGQMREFTLECANSLGIILHAFSDLDEGLGRSIRSGGGHPA